MSGPRSVNGVSQGPGLELPSAALHDAKNRDSVTICVRRFVSLCVNAVSRILDQSVLEPVYSASGGFPRWKCSSAPCYRVPTNCPYSQLPLQPIGLSPRISLRIRYLKLRGTYVRGSRFEEPPRSDDNAYDPVFLRVDCCWRSLDQKLAARRSNRFLVHSKRCHG
jgi:hypothetical protein